MPVKAFDKVSIVHGESGDLFEGFVHSVTKKYITIHEYTTDTYRTFLRESIKEMEVI